MLNKRLVARELRRIAEELDDNEILQQINLAVKKNPQLLYDFCKNAGFGDHDGWYDEIKVNTSFNEVLSYAKNIVKKNFNPEDYDPDYYENLVEVCIEYGTNSDIFYLRNSPDFENYISIYPFPKDLTLLPSEEEDKRGKGYDLIFNGKKWDKKDNNDIPVVFGCGYGEQGGNLYREDFLMNKDFFLK